jgi:hypothetical protein
MHEYSPKTRGPARSPFTICKCVRVIPLGFSIWARKKKGKPKKEKGKDRRLAFRK